MKTRRDFLRQTALASLSTSLPLAGLSGCAPKPTAPIAKPDTNKHTVGQGDFRFKVDKNWGDLDPRKMPVQHCHEMVLDARDRLVCSTVSDKFDMLAYNKGGKVVDSWKLGLVEAHGFTKAGEGSDQTFWITDTAGRVLNVDLDGRIIRELNTPTEHIPEGQAYKPTETAVAANGDIYVADGYGTNKIFHYDPKGRLVNVFGGPNHFNCCHGIVVDSRRGKEELLITSRANSEFQRWTMDGRHDMTRKLPGLQICRPVISGSFTLFAVIVTKSWSSYDGMIAVLDEDFKVVSLPGGSAPTNQEDFRDVSSDTQTFLNPHDVCLDADGNLYVPQWKSGGTYPVRLKRV
ncbi:MAG: 6-bladed beta-propeller [Bacteroidota bacterium]